MNKDNLFYTSINNNYLPKARVLAKSVKEQVRDATFYLVLAVGQGTGIIGVSAAREKRTLIILCVEGAGSADLLELIEAGDGFSPFPRLVESGEQHRRQNGDDGDYDQEFDKGEKHGFRTSGGYLFHRTSLLLYGEPFFYILPEKKRFSNL